MLYKYQFIKEHKMRKLNQNLLFFLRSIRNINKTATFKPENYFHSSFLNHQNKIAPNRRENKELTKRFKDFFDKFKKLDKADKEKFYKVVLFSRHIVDYFENITVDVNPMHADSINAIIGDTSFSSLMTSLWDNLKSNSWEIDKHYEEIFKTVPDSKICPFCGINQLANPKAYRTDYDHLAFKGNYPMSAINLENLAPSCNECNQKYKFTTDVFYDDDNRIDRRIFVYPYRNFVNVKIDFSRSILPNTDASNLAGQWEIDFIPNDMRTNTWNEVYSIKTRYVDEVLAVDYKNWIYNFIDEYKNRNINSNSELKKCFIKQFKRYHFNRLQKRYIIKSSFYRYLYKCNNQAFYDQVIKQLN